MPTSINEAQARQKGEWRDIKYCAWPTRRDYSFTFKYEGGGWRVYINNSPNYRGRPAGSVETHRLGLGRRPYICWTNSLPTISAAQGVAALWADCTEHYIATGRFEAPPNRPAVQDRSVLGDFAPAASAVPATFRTGAASPTAAIFRTAAPVDAVRRAWHEDFGFRLWGAGLIALSLCGLFWVVCMRNGFGFWDFLWMAGALAGAVVSVIQAEFEPGGRGWPIAYAVSVVLLGLTALSGAAPGLFWAASLWLGVANGVQYAIAAARRFAWYRGLSQRPRLR
ncbi:MAG: hypothetical protein LBK54_07350 [Propionibacteriaceae bacterium]|jgi:hypothetical protein|nr:hypothetical protein [Propionibacteriaceae bacterium]